MARHYAASWRDLNYKLLDGESNLEAQERFLRALQEFEAFEPEDGVVLVCAHGNVIALALLRALPDVVPESRSLRHCEIRRLEISGGILRWDQEFVEISYRS